MRFCFTAGAERQAIAVLRRWLRQGDYKQTFARELIDAEEVLTTAPNSGVSWKAQRGRVIRRWLLPKSKCHLYYRYEPERETVLVVAV